MRKARNTMSVQQSYRHIFSWLGGSAAIVCLLAGAAWGQDADQPGKDVGDYHVQQSVELGYRFTDFSGNLNTYNTFVNLQQGPRLLSFTTEMRSLNPTGSLFDRLFFSNFGYGGDPNDASRLNISKNHWYDFSAMFRRDQNYWDYSLQDNPLNPAAPFANAPAGFTPIVSNSPHMFDTVRHMGNYDLTLLPESKIGFRLGYSQNTSDGPSLSTIHEGTEQLLMQDWRNTDNQYHLGVDFRWLPKTNISYDQFWNYYKGDTGYNDQNQLYLLSNGTPVDLGVSLNSTANQPCGATFGVGGVVNPTCNAFISYTNQSQARTSSPTEQLALQSHYFKKLDLSARYSYTGAHMNIDNWLESLDGRSSRTNLSNRYSFGPISGERIVDSADLGATWHVTDRLDVSDAFYFQNFRAPATGSYDLCQYFDTSLLLTPAVFTPTNPLLNCPVPAGATAGTPVHSTSSQADASATLSSTFLGQDEKNNLVELEYQFSPKLGAHLGYRYRDRSIGDADYEAGTFLFYPNLQNSRSLTVPFTGTCPVANNQADGSCLITAAPQFDSGVIQIHEHSAVVGMWARPLDNLRITFDGEFMSADNAYTRISPRQTQEYRLRANYTPKPWLSVTGSMNIWEGRDNVTDVNSLQHNRAYGISATLAPNSNLSWEMGYNYTDIYSSILICYTSSTAPAGLPACPGVTGLVQQLSTYDNASHDGFFDLRWKYKQLVTRLGTNISSTGGTILLLNPGAPTGPLDSKYYRPFGGIEYGVAKNWTGKAYWAYYGYSEALTSVDQDLYAPRNFRGNMATLSMVYAF